MAVKVLELLGEEALQELYDLIDYCDGAAIAGREIQKITTQNSEYFAQLRYLQLKEHWEYKAAQYALKNGEVLGGNILKTATTSTSSAGTGLSTVSSTAEVAAAVDVGTYTAEGAEYAALKGVQTTATGTAANSTSTLGSFVFGEVLPFIGAVSTGVQIGLAIDEAIYETHPDWWHYNVENWDNVLLGHDTMLPILHDTNSGTTYITEDAVNTFMSAFNNMGVFNTGQPIEYDYTTGEINGVTLSLMSPVYLGSPTIMARGTYQNHNYLYTITSGATYSYATGARNGSIHFESTHPFTTHSYCIDVDTGEVMDDTTFTQNDPVTKTYNGVAYDRYTYNVNDLLLSTSYRTESNIPQSTADTLNPDTAYYYLYGDGIVYPSVPVTVDGIDIVGTTPSDTSSIANSYPSLWNNRITTTGVGTDGRNKTINWVPVPMPNAVGNEDALQSIIDKINSGELESTDDDAAVAIGTGDLTQTDDGSYEDEDAEEGAKAVLIPEALIDLINAVKEQTSGKIKIPTGVDVDVPTPPGTDNSGDGETDTPVVPAGSISNGLAMVYNPVRSELVSFSQYLWSTNFIDLIPKLFQDPMDAIIGLHEIYVTPSVGGRANIVCGYLDSGVESNYVDERYVTIDCGTVDISENFGSVFDYMYTDIEVFLPFIGFVKLDVAQVMRSKINIRYTVDVLNGACNARIYVKRDTYTVHSYSFDGCCAAALPYSAGTNTMIFQIVAGAVAGSIGGVGGAVTGAVKGALSGGINVNKSGYFNPNAASMDDKVPFIIIQRNIDDTPTQFNEWQGYPLHQTAILGGCKGYTIATNVHYSGTATADEVSEIEELLSNGIIL